MKLIFLLSIEILLSLCLNAQNPLKKELKGSTQLVYYSPTQYSFQNYKNQSIFISEILDNRNLYWNKQINDSIKIEFIRDFWNYSYKALFRNKIQHDLTRSSIKIDFKKENDQFEITPTVEVHYPNLVFNPTKGYWVYTKVVFAVSKNGLEILNKSYDDNCFFSPIHPEFKEYYLTNHSEGTNAAMWVGMKNVLDRFYVDLDSIFSANP